ncbi:O-antigen ligase like membrane protein [Blastococcus fimeti]|nr:O-antigen ligase like membrane protein [Blastococcus fimeti]
MGGAPVVGTTTSVGDRLAAAFSAGARRGRPTDLLPEVGATRGRVRLIALLVVVGAVTWRRGEYFSGSLDPVVLAKAAVSLLALGLALLLAQSGPRRSLGTGTVWWVGLWLGASVLGAVTAGNAVAGGVIAVRVGILAATIFLLLRAAPGAQVLMAIAWACGLTSAVAALTGLPSFVVEGRLAGGIPAIDPNDLALLAGVAVVVLAWRLVLDALDAGGLLGSVFFLGVVYATGSRTGLAVLVLAVVVMAAYIRRPRVELVVSGLVLGVAAVVALASTGAVEGFAARGGDGSSTLDSRFIAWRASLTWAESAWQQFFGGGLSVKIIRVRGQYWDTQPLDSSWVSLLVQGGIVGLIAAALWVLWVVRGTRRAPRSHRILFLGLLIFVIGRSVLESGLFDATPALLVLVAVSLLAEGGSRQRLVDEQRAGPVAG